jgi:hypothetical protein
VRFHRPGILVALCLSSCMPLYPGPSDDYDAAFAKTYYRDTSLANPPAPAGKLTLDQLYAAHRYGLNKMHPARSMSAEFARRGAIAAPFLRAKLEQQNSFGQVASILEAFKAMQEAGTFDVRSDPALVALIARTAQLYPDDPYHTLDDMADELETGTRIPTWFQPYWRKPLKGLGEDYDSDFAREYCRRCDYRDYVAGLDRLPLEQLYALQRYKGDKLALSGNVDHFMARRGAAAIPFLKAKLAGPGSDVMVWNIVSTIELMRDLGTYDVTGDAELMRLAEAAVMRVAPDPGPLTVQLERLRSGKRLRETGSRKLPWMGS